MDELKSAWEIAQERVDRLGKLSSDEKAQQETQRYRQIGQALARKWLDSSRQADIRAELSQQEAEGREAIRQAIVHHLVESVDITSTPSADSATGILEAISTLEPHLKPKVEETARLLRDYEQAEARLRQEFEAEYRQVLHQMRISGSAVGAINLEPDERWQQARGALLAESGTALQDLKQELLQ